MKKQIIITATIFGALAVLFGAFGAHGIKPHITPAKLEIWQTGVQYHFYHALSLLFLSILTTPGGKLIRPIYYAFTFGIILFSGSLYLLACRDLLDWSWITAVGPITPAGGVLLIGGWVMLAITAYKQLK